MSSLHKNTTNSSNNNNIAAIVSDAAYASCMYVFRRGYEISEILNIIEAFELAWAAVVLLLVLGLHFKIHHLASVFFLESACLFSATWTFCFWF